jgi:ankyrin repeat protein
MKHLLSYNESLRDLMKPKSEEEILSELNSLTEEEKNEKFLISFFDNDLSIFKIFLDNGINIDTKNMNGYTLLMIASQNGDLDRVKFLLEYGADINAKSTHNRTALIFASYSYDMNMDVIKTLLDNGAFVNVKDKYGNSALSSARDKGYTDVIKLLKEYGATEDINESLRDLMKPKSEDEIRDIIKEKTGINKDYIEVKIPEPKELKKVKTLLELSDEYKLDIKDYKDGIILMCGDIIGVFNFMKLYLNYALLNKRNKKDFYIDYILKNLVNSITESVRDLMKPKSDDEILKSLSDLNPNDLLMKSCSIGYLNGIKLALEKGADASYNNNYAIKYSSEHGYTEIVEFLLKERRVDPSDDDNFAIRFASQNGHIEIVKLLLQDKRVDPSAKDNSAIIYASKNGYTEIVKLLLRDERVDPSADNNYAIGYASYNGHTEIVKLFLQDSRVNPSADKNYAIKFASEYGHIGVVKLLLQDKRVREKLTDEEIKKYEKQINVLNESVRDLMKPKSEEEITSSLDKLSLKQKMDKLIDNGMLDRVSNEELKDYALSRKNAYEKILAISTLKIDHLFTDDELINILRQHTANQYEMTYGLVLNRIKIVEDAIKTRKHWGLGDYKLTEYGVRCVTEVEFAALKGYKDIVELLIKHGYHAYNLIPGINVVEDEYLYYELTDVLKKIGHSDIADLLIEKNAIVNRLLDTSFTIRIYSLPK